MPGQSSSGMADLKWGGGPRAGAGGGAEGDNPRHALEGKGVNKGDGEEGRCAVGELLTVVVGSGGLGVLYQEWWVMSGSPVASATCWAAANTA